MDRVAIFADVLNIYYTVYEKDHSHFDDTAFFKKATSGRQLLKAIAYATDRADDRRLRFQNILRKIGFDVRLTPFVQRADGSAKGDWGVAGTLDIVAYADRTDVLVLAPGDGDFTPVVGRLLGEHSIAVDFYGVPGLTASSLVRAATSFTPIDGSLLMPIPTTW